MKLRDRAPRWLLALTSLVFYALLLSLTLVGCRLPDSVHVGAMRGRIDGDSDFTTPPILGFGSATATGETELDVSAFFVMVGWHFDTPRVREMERTLRRIERAIAASREGEGSDG